MDGTLLEAEPRDGDSPFMRGIVVEPTSCREIRRAGRQTSDAELVPCHPASDRGCVNGSRYLEQPEATTRPCTENSMYVERVDGRREAYERRDMADRREVQRRADHRRGDVRRTSLMVVSPERREPSNRRMLRRLDRRSPKERRVGFRREDLKRRKTVIFLDHDQESVSKLHEREVAQASTGEVVLIVDDNPPVLRLARTVLRRAGYEILEAGSGKAALDVAERFRGTISLLLTDVVMPGMTGRELATVFRDRYRAVRIVYMSGYTEDEAILRDIRLAEAEFIQKPFTVQGLRGKIREVLDKADD